jgi:hypothetical protein
VNSWVIEALEGLSEHVLLCRPPRFGKSLLLDMLKCYYDERSSIQQLSTTYFSAFKSQGG